MDIDGFEIGHEIGRGGFGVVYQARQLAFDRDVAIKILHATNSADEVRRQFARECRAVGALRSHRNILNVYSTGTTQDGAPYLAMQLLRGGSLSDRLPLGVEAARTLGIKLASALQIAHDGGVIHRDVKPGNVLFDDDDEPVLVDFGISSIVGDASTTSTSVALSLGYAPPEVLGGARPAPAADVYALGATLFAALTNRTPFVGPDTFTPIPVLAARIVNQPVEDLRLSGVPDEFCRVIEKAMAKQPDDRFATATDLGAALLGMRSTSDDTVRAEHDTWESTQPLPEDAGRRFRVGRPSTKRMAGVLAAVVVLAGAATAAAVLSRSSTSGHPDAPSTKSAVSHKTARGPFDASDLDCDGHDDFLAVRTPKDPLMNSLLFYPRSAHNNGAGLPTDWAVPSYYVPEDPHFGASTFVSLVTPGDLTGDGDPDLVGQKSNGSLWLMPGNCTGKFDSATARELLPPQYSIGSLAAPGDFTGDGIPDLLAVYDSRLYLLPGNGHGGLRPERQLDEGWTSVVAVGDVNGDKRPDLIDRTDKGLLHLYEGDGKGGFALRDVVLSLTLPPSGYDSVLGGFTVSLSARPDLVAIDAQEMLVAFTPTGGPIPNLYSSTCKRLGGGWGTVGKLRPIADAAVLRGVPQPTYTKPTRAVPRCAG